MPGLPSLMTETDSTAMLHDLDRRHDDLLAQLEALEKQVELALSVLRPAASSGSKSDAISDRDAPTC